MVGLGGVCHRVWLLGVICCHLIFFLGILATVVPNGTFSLYVTAAILVIPNNETAAMLVYQENPQGVELFSYANTFFISNKKA